jgi:hypothetical protein
MAAWAVQRSPEACVTVATIVPAPPAITRRSEKEPLGARVFAVAEARIILHATVIRALLVPSLIKLFGSWNWWPPVFGIRLLPMFARVAGIVRGDASPEHAGVRDQLASV